ncbi:MAG: response regulator [Deltaproteobacteria bacterium]|nr:response regulator [Deltaproteobacteria bacterium]
MPRILIVDDDPMVQKTFRQFLALEGYEVDAASSADEASQLLAPDRYDTVLSDIEMPGEDGLSFLGICHDKDRDLPVVMVTGVPDVTNAISALRAGAFDYITKPVGRDLLLVTVARAVTTHKMIAEKRRLEIENRTQRAKLERSSLELEREVKRRTKALRAAEKKTGHIEKLAALGQLAAGIAHEINNPAGYVTSNLREVATALDNGGGSDEFWRGEGRQVVAECLSGMERITRICRELQDFAHTDSPEMVETDVNKCVEQAVVLCQAELKSRAKLETTLSPLPTVCCHPGKVTQVFINLLTNAAHAMGTYGLIRVESQVSDDNVIVRVTDNGAGIARENYERIFEPFFTTKEIGRGTGLGLYLVKGIIERHGGAISIESEEGRGTTFAVALPIHREPRPPG